MARDLWWAFAALAVACLWLVVAAVLAARRPLGRVEQAAWASGHGLDGLPARRLEPAGRYLRRSRLYRSVGAAVPFAAGTVAYALWAAIRGLPAPWPLQLFGVRSWLAGYLAGVLAAEYRWARPHAGAVRAAALVPRRLGDYLPDRVLAGMRLATLATAAVTLAVAVAVEWLLRRLVARPQPATDPAGLAVDDALRSTSVHAAAGAGLAIVLLGLSLQVNNLAANLGAGPGRTALVALSWGWAGAALAAWARVGHPRRWPVRRLAVGDAERPAGA